MLDSHQNPTSRMNTHNARSTRSVHTQSASTPQVKRRIPIREPPPRRAPKRHAQQRSHRSRNILTLRHENGVRPRRILPAHHHEEGLFERHHLQASMVPQRRHQRPLVTRKHGVHIWDAWADENGCLGPIYGHQWRECPSAAFGVRPIDQIANVIDTIRHNPDSRRIIVSSWNVAQISRMALLPCHCLFQFHVRGDKLDCQLYQRSADMFLGVPFNIASYSLLTMMIAQQSGYQPGRFIWVGGDTHIYLNHLEQVVEQLSREPRPYPHMSIYKAPNISSHRYEDFQLSDYNPHLLIKAPVAV